MYRGVPPCLLAVISNWYSKLSAVVRWNHVFSDKFKVSGGVRQGGVLSPVLFNLYVDELIEQLEDSGNGCSIGGNFLDALCMRMMCCYCLHQFLAYSK